MAENVIRVASCRAQAELKRQDLLTTEEYARLRAMVPDMGLDGVPFDDMSEVYPLRIPMKPHVVVFDENPRRVSLGLLYTRGRLVGVTGDEALESACLGHPGAFMFVVGVIRECKKEDKVYLNLRPRGWLVVEVGPLPPEDEGPPPRRGRKRRN